MAPRFLYKALHKDFVADPLPSRSPKGRFHADPGPTTYLAASKATAIQEVTLRWKANTAAYLIATVEASVERLVDLTDLTTQEALGISEAELVDVSHDTCQQLAATLRSQGAEAVWTYSRADRPLGRQMVVFLDQLLSSSYVRVVSIEPIGALGT